MLCRWVHKDIVFMNSCVNFKRDGEGVQLSEKNSRKKNYVNQAFGVLTRLLNPFFHLAASFSMLHRRHHPTDRNGR